MNEELKVIISAEIANLKSKVATAKKEIGDFGKKVSKYSKNIDEDFKAIGASISKGLKVAATATVGAAAGLLALGASTAEYRAAQAKLTTAFETAGASADTAKQTYNDLYRVLGDGDVAVEAAGHLAKLTTEEKALNEWTTICQGVYATFGDSIPIEGLTEAANETAKVGTLTGSLADALNWAGVNEETFQAQLDACNTEAEREALIRETLNGLYTDAAASYETNNAALLAQNEAQGRLSEKLAAVGSALQPVQTALTNLAADALSAIMPYIQSFAENYLPRIVEILGQVGSALETAFNWISQNKEILAVMAGIIGGIVAAIGLYNAVAAVKAAMDAAQVATLGGLIAAQLAHAAAAMAAIAPYVLIVAAIAAVIAIIVLCVKHWDKIKEVVVKVAKQIWEKVKEMAEKVGEWFGNMRDKITEAVSNAKQAAVNKFNEIKTGITTRITNIKTSIASTFTNISNTISTKISTAKQKALNIFDSIRTGIKSKIDAAKDAVSGAIDKIKGFLDFDFTLPKLKLPHLTISGKLDLFNIPPQIPKVTVDWYARGGVFDKPTLFNYGNGSLGGLGENGAEAVVPLENNTQWLDKIAEKLAAKQGSTPIVLTVDGKVFAQTSIDAINNLTRQRGNLALNLV